MPYIKRPTCEQTNTVSPWSSVLPARSMPPSPLNSLSKQTNYSNILIYISSPNKPTSHQIHTPTLGCTRIVYSTFWVIVGLFLNVFVLKNVIVLKLFKTIICNEPPETSMVIHKLTFINSMFMPFIYMYIFIFD